MTGDIHDLTTLLTQLAVLNQRLTDLQDRIQAGQDALQAIPEYQAYVSLCDTKKDVLEAIETKRDVIKETSLKIYEGTGIKKPAPGVDIRIYQTVSYSINEAWKWAKEYLPNAIVLDSKLFEKHAKAVRDTQPIPFVEYRDEPRPTVASDLSDYLPAT